MLNNETNEKRKGFTFLPFHFKLRKMCGEWVGGASSSHPQCMHFNVKRTTNGRNNNNMTLTCATALEPEIFWFSIATMPELPISFTPISISHTHARSCIMKVKVRTYWIGLEVKEKTK